MLELTSLLVVRWEKCFQLAWDCLLHHSSVSVAACMLRHFSMHGLLLFQNNNGSHA